MEDYYNIESAKDIHTSSDILRKILEKGKNDYVSCYAAKNSNCPQDLLRKILEKGGNDDVSCNAAKNPNCPDDTYIDWMYKTGRIQKEDPMLHIIEDDEDEVKIDKDLEILKKMVNY